MLFLSSSSLLLFKTRVLKQFTQVHHVSHYFRYITYNYWSRFCNDCVLPLFVKRMKVATNA